MIVSLNGDAGRKQSRLCTRYSTLGHSCPLKRLYIILGLGADRTSEAETDDASSSE